VDDQSQNPGFFGTLAEIGKAAREAYNEPLEQMTGPLLKDGMLAAAFRQGIDELGEALKPFPQSIQVQESGSIWNPTQGEIASARAELPTPSEIANDNHPNSAEPDRGNVHGQDNGLTQSDSKQQLPSPSEIADDNRPHSPERDPGQEHQQDHGRER
jgi:hypothetical protein